MSNTNKRTEKYRFDMYDLVVLDDMKTNGRYPNPVDSEWEADAELDGNELVVTFTEADNEN